MLLRKGFHPIVNYDRCKIVCTLHMTCRFVMRILTYPKLGTSQRVENISGGAFFVNHFRGCFFRKLCPYMVSIQERVMMACVGTRFASFLDQNRGPLPDILQWRLQRVPLILSFHHRGSQQYLAYVRASGGFLC